MIDHPRAPRPSLPCHYGYFDGPDGASPDGRPRAANELTITEWDLVSKQPLFKTGAVKVEKVADSGGEPAPAPTTTASAPESSGTIPGTVGGEAAEVVETMRGE
jgi:hypothetical protein